MRSPYSTIPNVHVTSTPNGHRVTCTACDFDQVRLWRASRTDGP